MVTECPPASAFPSWSEESPTTALNFLFDLQHSPKASLAGPDEHKGPQRPHYTIPRGQSVPDPAGDPQMF